MKINRTHIKSTNKSNILNIYNQATEQEIKDGLDWYNKANTDCLAVLAHFPHQAYNINSVAGITAALSPRNKWARNIIDTYSLLTDSNSKVGTFNANKAKALAIKNLIFATKTEVLDCLGGEKVRSFYQNILDPQDTTIVTVDGHAIGVWLGSRATSVSAAGDAYTTIQDAYIRTANELEIIPNQLQAITWLVYRRIHGIK
jgi:hypothetical protein